MTKFANVLVATIISNITRQKSTRGPRAATNWQKAPSSCGKGLRIGIVDNMLDQKHPAFKGVKIKHRSFHLKGQTGADQSRNRRHLDYCGMRRLARCRARDCARQCLPSRQERESRRECEKHPPGDRLDDPFLNFSIGGGKNKLVAKAIDHAAERSWSRPPVTGVRSRRRKAIRAYKPVIAVTAVDRFERSAKFAK